IFGRIFDADGGRTDYTTVVLIDNVVPVVTPAGNQTVTQFVAMPVSLGSFVDAGQSDGPWSVRVNWGDGSADDVFDVSAQGTLPARSHAYANLGTATVTVTVTDKDGGVIAAKTLSVTTVHIVTATLTGPADVVRGQYLTYKLKASGGLAADGYEYRV